MVQNKRNIADALVMLAVEGVDDFMFDIEEFSFNLNEADLFSNEDLPLDTPTAFLLGMR